MNSLIYLFGTLASAAMPFLLMPIMTSYLTPNEYGKMTLIVTLFTFILPILTLNAPAYIQRCYFDSDGLTRGKLISVFKVLIFYILIVSLVLIIYKSEIFTLFKIEDVDSNLMYILILTALCYVFYDTQLLLYNAKGSALKYTILLFLQSFLVLVFSTWFLYQGFGVFSRAYGSLLSILLFLFISIYFLVRYFKENLIGKNTSYKIGIEKDYLKYGIGFLPHVLSSLLLGVFDKIVIANFLTIDDVAIYAISAQYTSILLIVSQGLNREWVKKYFDHGYTLSNIRYRNRLILIQLVVVIIFYLSSDLFYYLFVDERYIKNNMILLCLLMAQLFHMIYMVFSVKLNYEKRSSLLSVLTFISLCVNAFISLALVGTQGVVGVAFGTVVGMLTKVILVVMLSRDNNFDKCIRT
ncbi:lipopolysaccharide biosynthesis protein [Aliivibrio sp. EL58]|uniref:lipopolysaccharide biosynthesis protein n=1 Tax=Aliivibrio sp. EL58 TaxID=2107582 RepID=UPI000EFCBAFA|nr:oligosaccharide flippase family protein [Aliivibrio sp. EL58]